MSRRGSFGWFVVMVAAIALPACSTVDAERHAQLEKDALDLAAQRDDARQDLAESLRREEGLQRQAEENARHAAELQAQAEEAARLAQEYADQNAELLARMAEQPAAGDEASRVQEVADQIRRDGNIVEVTPDGNIEITLPSDFSFSSGKAALTDTGKQVVRSLQPVLDGEYAAYEIRVIGHTDNTPLKATKNRWGTNRALGQARALSVVEFMEQEMGIVPTRLTTASKGEHDPVADNSTKAGMAKNRRVELVVVIPRESALSMAK